MCFGTCLIIKDTAEFLCHIPKIFAYSESLLNVVVVQLTHSWEVLELS